MFSKTVNVIRVSSKGAVTDLKLTFQIHVTSDKIPRGEFVDFSKFDLHAVWFISNTFISNIVRFWEKLRYRD